MLNHPNLSGKSRTYAVKEMFLSLQGEGYHAGRRAVFVRFAGCNLWSGREEDRATAQCKFCDTDFVGGQRLAAEEIAERAVELWGSDYCRFAVLTGGEPTLQVDEALIAALKDRCFTVAMESNGTLIAPKLDWLCVSPKAGTEVVQREGDELKVVWPQQLNLPDLERWSFRCRYLQPMDGDASAVAACLDALHAHPSWRLSLQTHKLLGLR
jgi:7-carboxy-7-deazaguanine synthase